MYRNIQLLRAFAALMVFFHHLQPHYAAMKGSNPLWSLPMQWGFAGVDVFFVISGFIMMHLVTDGPAYERNPRTFLGRRFVRIYSWYWVWALVSLAVLVLAHGERLATISLPRSFLLASLQLDQLVIPVSWSLTHELYFYLFTALLLLVRADWIPRVLLGVLALQVTYTVLVPLGDINLLTMLVGPYNIEFLAGCLLFFARPFLLRHGNALVFAALAVLCFHAGITYATAPVHRIPTFGLGAVFLVALALLLEARGRFVAGPALVAAGGASYTLYLSHLLFVDAFYATGLRDWLGSAAGLVRETGFVLFIAAVVVACVAMSRWLEMPLLRWTYRKLRLSAADAPRHPGPDKPPTVQQAV